MENNASSMASGNCCCLNYCCCSCRRQNLTFLLLFIWIKASSSDGIVHALLLIARIRTLLAMLTSSLSMCVLGYMNHEQLRAHWIHEYSCIVAEVVSIAQQALRFNSIATMTPWIWDKIWRQKKCNRSWLEMRMAATSTTTTKILCLRVST